MLLNQLVLRESLICFFKKLFLLTFLLFCTKKVDLKAEFCKPHCLSVVFRAEAGKLRPRVHNKLFNLALQTRINYVDNPSSYLI